MVTWRGYHDLITYLYVFGIIRHQVMEIPGMHALGMANLYIRFTRIRTKVQLAL